MAPPASQKHSERQPKCLLHVVKINGLYSRDKTFHSFIHYPQNFGLHCNILEMIELISLSILCNHWDSLTLAQLIEFL